MTFVPENRWRRVISLAFLFWGGTLAAQPAPWQQEVRYRINVELDDGRHMLRGDLALTYINRSPVSLEQLWFHLWPNAYRSRTTSLARQLVDQGDTKLYYAREEERGYIDSLRFMAGGQALAMTYDPEHIDICKVELASPLGPGDSVVITTSFVVKIPDARFSRLGHSGQAYYVTQWYPKPAVFDQDGWHPMPYLDQGEFYSEFGSFEVNITVPANYVVAATGDRVYDKKEEQFIALNMENTRAEITRPPVAAERAFPASSPEKKTLTFLQNKVHDFAWFADKRLMILGDSVTLRSGRVVKTWAYFTPQNLRLWKEAGLYLNRAVSFYSEKVGEYPYRHASAVDGVIMAGGGMEYPNITVIGNPASPFELEQTIMHEVGHNWFYGMLGNNERDHPFLDEGLNSFYELRYMRRHYPDQGFAGTFLGLDPRTKILNLHKVKSWMYHNLSFGAAQRKHYTQPMDLPAPAYTPGNYGAVVYSKSAVVFDHLLQVTGEEKFDAMMQRYFREFCFRHPMPADLRSLVIAEGILRPGAYDTLISSTRSMDYSIKRLRKDKERHVLSIKNRTGLAVPFVISSSGANAINSDTVISGFTGERTFTFAAGANSYRIDREERMPEINRRNNTIRVKGLFRKSEPLQVRFLTAVEDPGHVSVYYSPVVGGNYYNGLMAGLALHNYGIYQKRFEWAIVPMYGIRSRSFAGVGDVEYKWYPAGLISQVNLGAGMRSFAFSDRSFAGDRAGIAHYYRLAPFAELVFSKRPLSTIHRKLTFTHHRLRADSTASMAWDPWRSASSWQVNQLAFGLKNSRTLFPYSFSVDLQQAGEVIKAGLTADFQVDLGAGSNVLIRCFGGSFMAGGPAKRSFYAFRSSGHNGYQDYLLNRHFFGRNERSGIGFAQFSEADGNLKTWTSLGQSATWMGAVNLKSPRLPFVPIRIFGDVVVCDRAYLAKDPLLWDAGLNLVLLRDLVEVYYALIFSDDIRQDLAANGVGRAGRIRFTFNIDKLAPKRLIRDISF